jgi:AcrR family transcriptional regulator
LEEGWDAVTQERVAARAGLARATVYRHWPDRAALLIEAIEPLASAMHGQPSGEFRVDLVAELDRFQRAISQPSEHRLLAALVYYGSTDPEIEQARKRMVAIHDSFLREVLRRAVESEDLDPSTDPDEAVAELMGPLCYRLLLSGEPTSRHYVEGIVDRFIAARAPRCRAPVARR